MTNSKSDWDNIPSIDGLGVDWEYEPESPLGKRSQVRVATKDLRTILGKKSITVKVATQNGQLNGYLVDIAEGGIGVVLNTRLVESQPVKFGLFLGEQKIISRAMVRSVIPMEGGYRIGMEFVELQEEYKTFIAGLISSKVYKTL